MDPNLQPIQPAQPTQPVQPITNAMQQASPIAQAAPPPASPSAGPSVATQMPQKGSKKGIVLILILLLLIVGMGVYILFAKKQLTKPSNNTTVAAPTAPAAPSPSIPQTIEEVVISNPETELSDIEKDLEGL